MSQPVLPSCSVSQGRLETCNPATVVIHDCNDRPKDQQSSSELASRVWALSLQVVSLAATKIVLPNSVARAFSAILGWWIGFLLAMQRYLEGTRINNRNAQVEEIEMEEGVGRRKDGEKGKVKEASAKTEQLEDNWASEQSSSTSSGDYRDSCESLVELAILKPAVAVTDTRSTTWNSAEQVKAKKVLGFRSETVFGDQIADEGMTIADHGNEQGSRATTWGSSKALKILGFSRQNSRLIATVAIEMEEMPDRSLGPTGSKADYDCEDDSSDDTSPQVVQPKRANLMKPRTSRGQDWISTANVLHPPSTGVFLDDVSKRPMREGLSAIPRIADAIRVSHTIAGAIPLPRQKDANVDATPPPNSELRPPTFRHQTAPTPTPYRSLIPTDDPNPSHQPTLKTEPPHHDRSTSAFSLSRTPSVSRLPRARSTSLSAPSDFIRPFIPMPPQPESAEGLTNEHPGRHKLARPHSYRFWSRTRKAFESEGE